MATKVCPNCGWRKDIATTVCHCGYDFETGKLISKDIQDQAESDAIEFGILQVEFTKPQTENLEPTGGVKQGSTNRGVGFLVGGLLGGFLGGAIGLQLPIMESLWTLITCAGMIIGGLLGFILAHSENSRQ